MGISQGGYLGINPGAAAPVVTPPPQLGSMQGGYLGKKLGECYELAGDPHLGPAGRAPLEGIDHPAVGPGFRLAVQRVDRGAGNH